MPKENKIILIIIALLVFIPILINEIKEYNLRELKKEVLHISKILENYSQELTEIEIKNNIKINNEKIKIRGTGKAFVIKDSVTVVISYKEYCAVKSPIINEVALSKSICPKGKIIDGKIIQE